MGPVEENEIMVVKPGLCLVETYDPSTDLEFDLEAVSWPGVQLPKALETWSEWLSDK